MADVARTYAVDATTISRLAAASPFEQTNACRRCRSPSTSTSTSIEIAADIDIARPHQFPGAIEEARGVGGF